MCKFVGVRFVLQLQLQLILHAVDVKLVDTVNMFADRMPPPGGQCRNQIMQSRSMNISIIIQPPLFSLDSGRQFLHTRQFCLLPTNLRLNDKVLKMKYAEAGFYMNKKLAKAQLAAENGNQEMYPLSPRSDNETEFGFAIRREPSLRINIINGITNNSPV